MADSTDGATETTRRAVLRRGLTLAVAAPAMLGALSATAAWADHDDDDSDDDHDDHGDNGNHGNGNNGNHNGHDDFDDLEERLQAIGLVFRFSSRLCRVADATSFPNSGGTDPLTAGVVRLLGRANIPSDNRVGIALRGAAASVSYQVWFQRTSDGGRDDLGVIGPTSSNGFLNATAPNVLPSRRVGVVVLARNGIDQFVSCAGD
jgi:hypothetical protein